MSLAHRPRIVVAESYESWAVERLQSAGEVIELPSHDPAQLLAAVADCDALLVRTYARVMREVIDAAPRLRVIGRAGVGLDNIDVDAARHRHITVVYTPAAATDAVADLTIGMMITLTRGLHLGDAAVREGAFHDARQRLLGRELAELSLGIIGMGRIGRAVARRARHGFGMRIIYNDIRNPGWLDFPAEPLSKEDLYASCDVVSLHVPLTSATQGMIDAPALARFRRGAWLINTARGAVVDGIALAEALRRGTLRGAALDVLDPEPLPPDHPLRSAPNTLLLPHIGARTPGAQRRMNGVVEDVIRVLNGQPPENPAW